MRYLASLLAVLACLHARATPIEPVLRLEDFAGAYFGRGAAGIGDVNGDGFADLAVGQPYAALSASEQYGRVFVHYGSASGPSTEFEWYYEGTIHFGNIGYALAGGDVNGDGFSDLLVAGDLDGADGLAYAFFGSATGLAPTPSWSVRPSEWSGSYGDDIAAADVDDDGYDNVLFGAPHCTRGEVREGCVYLYRGGPTGPATTPAWIGESNQADSIYGRNVARAGDLNGDGYQDVAVGAPGYDGGQTNEGRVFVYHGSASGLPAAPSGILELDQAVAYFGWSVASAGDANGDRFADLAVGARLYDGSVQNEGAVFLFQGAATGIATSPSWQASSGQSGSDFGNSVALVGNFDGDAWADLVVGAGEFEEALPYVGRAFLYKGNGSTFSNVADYLATGTVENGGFAALVAGAGDTDADGFDELMVGASQEFTASIYTLMTHAAGVVVPTGGGPGLSVEGSRYSPTDPLYLSFTWPDSCSGDADYALFEGRLGNFASHVPVTCGTGHATWWGMYAPPYDAYYLVVPLRLGSEGSYGRTSAGAERPPSVEACSPQQIMECP